MPKPIIDKERLRGLWNKGYTAPKIAEMMGCSVGTIYKRAHQMNLPNRPRGYQSAFEKDPEKKKWFMRNYPNLGNDIIALYLDVKVSYVEYIAHKYGLHKSNEFLRDLYAWKSKNLRKYQPIHNRDKNGRFAKTENR